MFMMQPMPAHATASVSTMNATPTILVSSPLAIKNMKRDRSTSHMQTCCMKQPHTTLLQPSTSTPVKTFTHITHQTCNHSDGNMIVPEISSCSSINDHTSTSTLSISSASLSGSESRSVNNKSPTSPSLLQRTTSKGRSPTSQNDNESSSSEDYPSNDDRIIRSFNSCKMKSSDLKNKFTTSKKDQVIRCNRTSGNQRSFIGYQDIKGYFFLPENEAAKRLGCSKSKLKRIKTRLNIERWPYRRIQSLLNQKQNALSKNENVEDIEMAIQFVIDYPNLITKYSNEDIALTASRFDRIRISNLL